VAKSIKAQIIARLLELCQPLATAPVPFRLIERKHTVFLIEAIKPALHLVVGQESQIGEDTRGYTKQFPAWFKIMLADSRDAYGLADDAAAFIQQAIEADFTGGDPTSGKGQLRGLANKIQYEGEQPFTDEAIKPDGGTVVMYTVEYRTPRGDPYSTY
jgi:hypothetical protein